VKFLVTLTVIQVVVVRAGMSVARVSVVVRGDTKDLLVAGCNNAVQVVAVLDKIDVHERSVVVVVKSVVVVGQLVVDKMVVVLMFVVQIDSCVVDIVFVVLVVVVVVVVVDCKNVHVVVGQLVVDKIDVH